MGDEPPGGAAGKAKVRDDVADLISAISATNSAISAISASEVRMLLGVLPGVYYHRVQAVDEADNTVMSSEGRTFLVVLSPL